MAFKLYNGIMKSRFFLKNEFLGNIHSWVIMHIEPLMKKNNHLIQITTSLSNDICFKFYHFIFISHITLSPKQFISYLYCQISQVCSIIGQFKYKNSYDVMYTYHSNPDKYKHMYEQMRCIFSCCVVVMDSISKKKNIEFNI